MSISGGGVYSADGTSVKLSAGQFSLFTARSITLSDTPGINGTQAAFQISGSSIAAASRVRLHCYIALVGGGATTMNFQIHATGAPTIMGVYGHGTGSGAVTVVAGYTTSVTTNIVGAGTTAGTYVIEIDGIITMGAAQTQLQVDMVDTGVTNTLKAGSWAEMTVI